MAEAAHGGEEPVTARSREASADAPGRETSRTTG